MASDVNVSLYRKKLTAQQADLIAIKGFAVSDNVRKAGAVPVDADFAKIANNEYSYGFGTCLGSGDASFAARIKYSYTHAGD